MNARVDAVVFDLYDTVVFVDPARRMLHQEALARRLGLPADVFLAEWRATGRDSNLGRIGPTGDRFREVIRRTGTVGDPSELAGAEHAFLRAETRTIPGMADLLVGLRARGVRLGLLSNCSASARFTLDAAGVVVDAFDTILLSCEAGLVKPDRRFFRLAARELSVDPTSALYVADGVDGELEAAVGVGMRAVRATWANPAGSGPPTAGIASTVDELARLLG